MNIKTGWTRRQGGFTIVELLIVIVVIGILAAIVVVAYNGVQKNAQDAAIKSDLSAMGKALHNYKALKGTYPTTETEIGEMNNTATTGLAEANVKVTRSAYDVTTVAASDDTNRRNILVCVRNGGSDPRFGIVALSKSGKVWLYKSDGGVSLSPDPWVGQQTAGCPKVGVTFGDPGYARWFGYQRAAIDAVDSGWRGWTTQ